MVLAFHICQRWPVTLPAIIAFTQYGIYGVDLFFVLSGWLIGSLFWREYAQFSHVEIGRFIGRRALRTVPPYFVALVISYVGVLLARGEAFDVGYLVFLQNYYERIPFFLISWSLCIEEHFYLVMPILALSLARAPGRSHIFFLLLAVIPAVCRFLICHPSETHPFGYYYTATHLRYEGLLLGVWASFLHVRRPQEWVVFRRFASIAILPALSVVIVTAMLPDSLRYPLFYTAVAVFFLLLLVTVVDRQPLCFSDTKVVFWIASTSYSVYLTHAFTLDASLRLLARLPEVPVIQVLVVVACVAIAGYSFYRIVEVPSLAIRHRLMPGRTSERSRAA